MFQNKNLVTEGNVTPELPSEFRKNEPENVYLRESLAETQYQHD
jgi:hypothetical protein